MPNEPNECQRIADQLRRVYEGLAWQGPSLLSVLTPLTAERASARPIAGAHSIWEITLHLTAWLQVAQARLTATQPVDPTPAEDWPAPTGSWQEALAKLEAEQRRLEDSISAFPVERLSHPAPASESQSYYDLLHGIVQHTSYHTGQILLLSK